MSSALLVVFVQRRSRGGLKLRKERYGIEIKRRGWSIIDADAQKRRGMYNKKKTVGVLIAEETDLYEYLLSLPQ